MLSFFQLQGIEGGVSQGHFSCPVLSVTVLITLKVLEGQH